MCLLSSSCTGNHDSCTRETNPSPSVNEALLSRQCHDQEDGCTDHGPPLSCVVGCLGLIPRPAMWFPRSDVAYLN